MSQITALVLLPVVLNLSLYLIWLIFGVNYLSSILAVVLTIICLIFYFKKNSFGFKKITLLKRNHILSLLLIIGNIFLISLVLSPYVRLIKIDDFVSIGLSSVTDIFKHSYVITSIKSFGLPPHHPYFPPASFSYYYGYYLIPTLFSYFLPQFQNYFLFTYILFTDLISLLILYFLINKLIKNNFLKILSLALIIFGMGLDFLPMFLDGRLNHPDLIEMWAISNNLVLRVDNTFVSLLWTPQHFFAVAVSALFIYKIIYTKASNWILFSLFSFVFLSSAFVALALVFITFLIFILIPPKRQSIFKIGIFSIVILLPYLLNIAQKGGSMFRYYHFSPYSFIANQRGLNYFFSLLFEYGFIFLFLPLFIPLFLKKIKPIFVFGLFMAIYIPIIITWFICSSGYNDFALRGIILSQLLVIILFVKAIELTKNRVVRFFAITLIFLNLLISFLGFLFEYYSRWKTRKILDPYASELIVKLRSIKEPFIFAAAGKEEWIYNIPPLAFKAIYTTDLYDSGGYLQNNPNNIYGDYENKEKNIYFRQNIGLNIKDIILQRNNYLSEIKKFVTDYKYDWVIFDNRFGVKNGKNFWVPFFKQIGVVNWQLTSTFTAFNRQSLIEKLNEKTVAIDQNKIQIFKIIDNKVTLPFGFWYGVMCNQNKSEEVLEFEPEDAYSIFNSSLKSGACVGNLFYLEKKSLIKLIGNHSPTIFLFPVDFN